MRRFLLIFFALILCGCQLLGGGKKHNSAWTVLDSAASVDCGDWPLRTKDLQISEIKTIAGDGGHPGLLAIGTGRDGAEIYYYVPFTGDVDIDADDLVPLKLGRSAVLLGATSLGDKTIATVVHNQGTKTSLELRGVLDNVVRFKSQLSVTDVIDGKEYGAGKGAWLNYHNEDENYRVAYLDLNLSQPKKTSLRHFRSLDFPSAPLILPQSDKAKAVVIWRGGKADNQFLVQSLSANGQYSQPTVIDVPIKDDIESWSAAASGDGYYLAYVEGDSLVGQANLRISFFNWNVDSPSPTVQWSKEQTIKDVHVTEPVVLSEHGKASVLLLNWVDEESTIARYRVSDAGIEAPEFAGVFAKGARILGTLADDGNWYAIVRHRNANDTKWMFQVCRL